MTDPSFKNNMTAVCVGCLSCHKSSASSRYSAYCDFAVVNIVVLLTSTVADTVVISSFCHMFRCVACISSLHLPSNK